MLIAEFFRLVSWASLCPSAPVGFCDCLRGVFVLRFTDPQIQGPFRVPAFWLIAPLGVFFCLT